MTLAVINQFGHKRQIPAQLGSRENSKPVLRFFLVVAMTFLAHGSLALAQMQTQMQSRQKLQTVVKEASSDDIWKARWKISLSGNQTRSEDSEARLISFGSSFDLKYYFDPTFFMKVAPTVQLQSGSTQSPDSGAQPANAIVLSQASANWKPTTWSHLLAGALDQGERHSGLLIGSRPFPGARSVFEFGDTKLLTRFSAESAIPTSASLSTNANQIEPTPSFSSAQLELEGKPSTRATWMIGAGVFAYENLPGALAKESSFRGNTVDRLTATHSVFREHYRGVEGRLRADLPVIKRISLKLKAEGVQNTAAPTGYNQAWVAGGGLGFRLNRTTDIALTGETFRIEPDAAVASFISGDFGSTNRNGYAGEFKLSFQKGRYNVKTRVGESELIFVNSPQSRERFATVSLETEYVDF